MSIRLMTKVWGVEGLTPEAKLVLLYIADCSGDDGTGAYPSAETICRHCGMGSKEFMSAKAELRARGIMVEMHLGHRDMFAIRLD